MAIQLTIPKPGDLITADYARDVVTVLQQLDARIKKLEDLVPGATGQLVITDLRWTRPDLHINDELTIIGVNLGLQGETWVDFERLATVTTFKPGSNDRTLILDVPPMPLGGPSKTLVLTVGNPRTGADSRTITVFEGLPTIPDGTILVQQPQFPNPEKKIQPGNLVITFPLVIQALNMDTVFNITTSAMFGSPPSAMTTVALNELDQQITTIALPKFDQSAQPLMRTIKVKVTIPALPAGVATADAMVRLALSVPTNSRLSPSSGNVPFTIGQPPPVSAFSFDISTVQGPGSYDGVTSTLHLPRAQTPAGGYVVSFRIDLSSMPAHDTYTVAMQLGSTEWSIVWPDKPSFDAGIRQLVTTITPGSGETKLTTTITGTDPAHSAQKMFTLQPS